MGAQDRHILLLAGKALYGERWQSPLARDLGTTDRTLRYWYAGSHPGPSDLADRLAELLRQRGERLQIVISDIEKLAGESIQTGTRKPQNG